MDVATVLASAQADAALAPWSFGEDPDVFSEPAPGRNYELLTDVWVFADSLSEVLLVRHPRRGWVMPGGKVEPGETFRAGAVRELQEETGLALTPSEIVPAGAGSRTTATGDVVIWLSYSAVVTPGAVRSEPGQEARWWPLAEEWDSIYPHDRPRLLNHRDLLERQRSD